MLGNQLAICVFLFKKSKLFYCCTPAHPIFQEKTDANQTINWLRPKIWKKTNDNACFFSFFHNIGPNLVQILPQDHI